MYLFGKKVVSPTQTSFTPQQQQRAEPTSAPVDQLAAAGAKDMTSAHRNSQSMPWSQSGPTPGASPTPAPPPTGVTTPVKELQSLKAPPHTLIARVWQLMGEQPSSAEQISSID